VRDFLRLLGFTQDDGDHVVLSVHNEGSPIPPDKIETIFEALTRAEEEPSGNGMGLGLYITKKVVTAHRGTIEVVSTKEAGTTFTVRLCRVS